MESDFGKQRSSIYAGIPIRNVPAKPHKRRTGNN